MRLTTGIAASWMITAFGTGAAQTPGEVSPIPIAPLQAAPETSAPTLLEALPEAATVPPNPYAGDLFTRSKLLGDLGGLRSSLADRGVTFDLFGTQFYQGVTQGGKSRDFEYGGKFDYLLNIDGHKLGLWQGLFVNLHVESRLGRDVNGIDGLLVPSNISMSFPASDRNLTSVTGLKLTQALSENFVLFAGKLNTLEAFPLKFNSGSEANLPGLGGFQSTALVFNPIAARTVPYSTFGAGAAIISNGVPIFSFTVLDPEERSQRSLDNLYERGVVLVPDLILQFKTLGLPAVLNLGGTYSNADYRTVDPSAYLNLLRTRQLLASLENGGPVSSDSWSLYANGYQALWADPEDEKRSWGVFGCLGLSDGDPNPIRYSAAAGIGGRSMIATREADTFGIGYYYLGLSDQFKNLTRFVAPQRDEYGVELFYNVAVTPWCRLTPNLQIARPSTVGADTSLITGIRLQLIF